MLGEGSSRHVQYFCFVFVLFVTVSVDDGTEEDDSDSHIMVWTLPESGNISVSVSVPPSLQIISPSHSLQPPSTSSSSLELGATPGSGLALDSQSDSDSDTETEQAWSQDVEEMLNNPPPEKFQSFNLSREPSLSSWVVSDTNLVRPSVSPILESLDILRSEQPRSSPPQRAIEPMEDFTGHFPAEDSSSVLT